MAELPLALGEAGWISRGCSGHFCCGMWVIFIFCFVLSIRVFRLVFLRPFQARAPELEILGCFLCISELPREGFFYRKTPVTWSQPPTPPRLPPGRQRIEKFSEVLKFCIYRGLYRHKIPASACLFFPKLLSFPTGTAAWQQASWVPAPPAAYARAGR